MNRENMITLRNHLEKLHLEFEPTIGFNLDTWYSDTEAYNHNGEDPYICGTVACIAGHAAILSGSDPDTFIGFNDVPVKAREWLGLTVDQAYELFEPHSVFSRDLAASAQDAAAVLTRMLDGEDDLLPSGIRRMWYEVMGF